MTIVPIKELKDTAKISDMCAATSEPIYITKNGYGDMVIMNCNSFEAYLEKQRQIAAAEARRELALEQIAADIRASEADIAAGHTRDAFELIDELRVKYGL
ncbi:MAG TPA: type II toxin-antitoxin system Phd/YefM family antitoxin [Candidatus Limicola stercorigallinarum]|nr:type II toxin-antitoxin system Phd/YefM family antitoxin [Candidatus Limicola stercorigallinarum]